MTTDIQALIAQAIADGRDLQAQRDAEIEAAEAARKAADKEARAQKWAEPLALIKAELPEWMHPYVSAPDSEFQRWDEYEYLYAPAQIRLPDLAPIYAYADIAFEWGGANRSVGLVVPTARIQETEDGETVIAWLIDRYWRPHSDSNNAVPAGDWQRAVAKAARRGEEEQLERRREAGTTQAPSPTSDSSPRAQEELRQHSLAGLDRALNNTTSENYAIAAALVHLCTFGVGGGSE